VNWRDVYAHAVELYGGQTPGAQLEANLLERFEQHPTDVVAAIDKLGVRFASGRVHSPWPLVLRELDSAPDRGSITASDDSDRARAIHLAERYIANAGMFMPQAELVDELFGVRGKLRHWPELEPRMVAAWQARQPAAAQVKREQLERAERWRKAHQAMQGLGTERTSDAHHAESEHSSQTSVPLTRVSAPLEPSVDADIVW